jgi:protein-disulfide isomerase
MKSFLVFFAVALSVLTQGASAQGLPAQHRILAADGTPVANFDLSPEMLAKLQGLTAQMPVGDLNGDVTLMQFYDLNCPYCRMAAHDVDAILQEDKKLKLIFVPYAVLSLQSVQGALIEVAASKMLTPAQYLEFHRKLYANRGTIDGQRALAAAKDMGLDPQKVAAAGDTEATLRLLQENATVGGQANLVATPAYVIGGVAIVGHPGRKALEKVIADMRQCGKATC